MLARPDTGSSSSTPSQGYLAWKTRWVANVQILQAARTGDDVWLKANRIGDRKEDTVEGKLISYTRGQSADFNGYTVRLNCYGRRTTVSLLSDRADRKAGDPVAEYWLE